MKRRHLLRLSGAGFAVLAVAAWSGPLFAQGGRTRPPPLLMTTTAFKDGGVIPDKYTQAAGPMAPSPALQWSQVPEGTQSFVLLMHDPEPVLAKSSKMDWRFACSASIAFSPTCCM